MQFHVGAKSDHILLEYNTCLVMEHNGYIFMLMQSCKYGNVAQVIHFHVDANTV